VIIYQMLYQILHMIAILQQYYIWTNVHVSFTHKPLLCRNG